MDERVDGWEKMELRWSIGLYSTDWCQSDGSAFKKSLRTYQSLKNHD